MKNYWIERWKREDTGFHSERNQPLICASIGKNCIFARGSEVFVPLCGKSRDMLWLREQGYSVLGVELSSIAVQAFFEETAYSPSRIPRGKISNNGKPMASASCAVIFSTSSKDDLAKASAVYDRASLVALPPDMRARYAFHLLGILPPGTQILLITFDYPQQEMPGPPFAVSPGEVEALYRGRAEIRLLAQLDVLEQNPALSGTRP